jgi:GNAT superfamily N-acetyltransferase
MSEGLRVEKLRREHAIESFACGQPALDRFLTRYALQSQQAGASNTYVALDGDRVIGFHSLAYASVDFDDAPGRVAQGLARHSIPVMLLARLAVASDYQGRGLGSSLLKDATLRTIQAADIAGLRAILVHAKDDSARKFYIHFGFAASPTDPCHLMLLLKDARAAVAG